MAEDTVIGGVKAKTSVAECELSLRVTICRPPDGVRFGLQSGREGVVGVTLSTGDDLSFDFSVRVKDTRDGRPPRLLGPFAQGPADARFVYVCSETLAGQADSCWTRWAKVALTGISWPLIRRAMKGRGSRLEALYAGTARDGGPSCASVTLTGNGWRPVQRLPGPDGSS